MPAKQLYYLFPRQKLQGPNFTSYFLKLMHFSEINLEMTQVSGTWAKDFDSTDARPIVHMFKSNFGASSCNRTPKLVHC